MQSITVSITKRNQRKRNNTQAQARAYKPKNTSLQRYLSRYRRVKKKKGEQKRKYSRMEIL